MEDMPRSISTAPAWASSSSRRRRQLAKGPCIGRTCTPVPTVARSASTKGCVVGSRSMATSWPLPSRPRASRREWPPAPKVQSTISSPGCTSSNSPTSCASTGTCASGLGLGKTFGNTLGAPFDLGELATPGLAVPDLEPVPQAGDDDVLGQLGVLEERRGQRDAALSVELAVQRAAEE